MSKPIVDVVQGILIVGEAQIALLVKPYLRRGKILDKHPLSDVELPPLNQKWILNVFLHDELRWLPESVIGDIIEVVKAPYSSSPRHNYLSTSLQLGLAIQTFLIPLIPCCGSPLASICILVLTNPSITSNTFSSYPSSYGFSITGISHCCFCLSYWRYLYYSYSRLVDVVLGDVYVITDHYYAVILGNSPLFTVEESTDRETVLRFRIA